MALLQSGGLIPQAVVTDMVMPGMDGASLLRAVREHLSAPTLPAVLVSGYAEEALRRDLSTSATGFLPKPYSLKALVQKLDEVVASVAEKAR
jgi:CheY-like chemotaxis protein